MRKTIFTFIFMAAAMIATAQEFTISCKVAPDYNGKTAYIVNKNANDTIAECVIADNAFKYSGEICCQAVIDVVVNRPKGLYATVLVGKGTDAVVDMTARPAVVSDNGGMNDALTAMFVEVKDRSAAIGALAKRLQEEGKSEEEILAATTAETEALYDVYRNAINDNSDNMLGAYVLNMVARRFYSSVEELDAITAKVKFSGEFPALDKIRKALYYGEKTRPGNGFIDFGGLSLDGKPARLSDYVGNGKYLLVDFWASWCGPCKKEMPKVIEVYNKYSGDKFAVIGVNIGDKEDSFRAAVPELGIPYPQIFIPRNSTDENNAALLYNVETIPHLMLIAPDGTILERGIHGADLEGLITRSLK